MSIDPVAVLNAALTAVVIGILVVGLYRATEMRRAFVNIVYRSRATWYIILMLTIIVVNIIGFVPVPSTGTIAFLGFLPFLALLGIILAFVDSSVLVAVDADFFHRNTLRWQNLRMPAFVALIGSMALGGVVFSLPSTNSTTNGPAPLLVQAAFLLFFIVVPLVLTYGTAALIVAARRTPDKALKRSILLLGLALSTLVVSIVATFPFNTGSLPYVIINQGTSVIGIYLIYRSVMSLSPISRISKEDLAGALPNIQTPKM